VFLCKQGAHILGTGSPGEFHMVAFNVYASSVWNMLHVTPLAPGILRWFLASWKICALLYINIIMKQKGAEWVFKLSIWLWVLRNWDDSTLKVINAISCWDCMSVISERTSMNHGWNGDNRKTEVLSTKPLPLLSPQMPHGLAWDWIWAWASSVRGKWLIIWAKAWTDLVKDK